MFFSTHTKPKPAEAVFVGLFVVELIVKMIGLRPHMYFESKFNSFDFVVVLISLLELILANTAGTRSIGISSLRSLRLLRIFREMKQYWEDINDFVSSLINSIASIASLLLLILIYMVIVALLGMQLLGGRCVCLAGEGGGEQGNSRCRGAWVLPCALFA